MKKNFEKNSKKNFFLDPPFLIPSAKFSNLEFWTENFWIGSPKDGEYQYNHETALILLLRPLGGAKNSENRDFGLIWAKKAQLGGQKVGRSKKIFGCELTSTYIGAMKNLVEVWLLLGGDKPPLPGHGF